MHPVLVDYLDRLRVGPSGPQIVAFFDLTGALVEPYTAAAHHSRPRSPTVPEQWAGSTRLDIQEQSDTLFRSKLAGSLRYEAWSLLRAHQNLGHTVAMVTEVTDMEAHPWAQALGIEHVLCSRVQTRDDILTGTLADPVLRGVQKCSAIREFAAQRDLDLALGHAYTDSDDDIALLDAVGNPHPINPHPGLARHARSQRWLTLPVAPRRRGRTLAAVARTAAMYASLVAAGTVGIAAGAVRRSSRHGVDLATTLFGTWAPRLGRITITIGGHEHARSPRPAVFFVNHQSTLIDVVVTARVIGRRFTIVVKKEVRSMPLVGRLFELAEVAFLDKSNTSQAISALQPAVTKLRSGISIAMAPEGTRSLTPAVAAFKKGGFHLARDAGVPIVPIVIRNAGELMWRNDVVAQKGTVDVVVHRALPTVGWDLSDIDRWRSEMHQLYTDTLDNWPGEAAGRRWSQLIDDIESLRP